MQTINYIQQRLSLREPLRESLAIVAQLTDTLALTKEVDLATELEKVQALFPTCQDFERDFPSLCFSIATGVGKTRLMGACVAYLHLRRGVRNFFILAPNLTIYEKLIEDFGNPNHPKYVFRGISEFVHRRPLVVTGENYAQAGSLFNEQEVRINIFNIAKFNRDAGKPRGKEKGMLPRIKRLSEYLGQSYWEYLSGLDDLVVLMDEAHRYHADASRNAINELKPILGLELTATPLDEKSNPFRNIVYEYSLAQALADGKYVKNPAIATRKNFRSQGLSADDIEKRKLEDAVSVHRATQKALEVYALNNQTKRVKPFILVVCRDIGHAVRTHEYLNSRDFYQGAFANKVLQIDSSTKREEEIEKQFVELENYDNEIEIVIHVNMLKEGWDVSNLYTIVPLRAANAAVLIEQTIGRGLRLPYHGERTGVDLVDKLTVIAHDNFEKVIEAAQDPNSVLNKLSFVELDEDELKATTEVVTSVSRTQRHIQHEEQRIQAITDEDEKQLAKNGLDARKAIIRVLPTFHAREGVTKVDDLTKPEVKQMVIDKVKKRLAQGQLNVFSDAIVHEAESIYESVVNSFKENTIEIPRMDLVQDEVAVWFEDFDLDTASGFNFDVLDEEIMVVELTGERRTDRIGVSFGALSRETPTNQIITELINYPEIDYDNTAELLHQLTRQAIAHLEGRLADQRQLPLLVRQYRKLIASRIYEQMKKYFRMGEPTYVEPNVLPFVRIENWNFSAVKDGRRDYRDMISPARLIPKLVFSGYKKASHFEYKFDSKTEKDFAYILENDARVLKWLRPAPNQFRIYWANNAKQYHPDFVIETDKTLYLVETKAADQLEVADVVDKKKAALQYCRYATDFTTKNNGKPWRYLLIPHHEVTPSTGFGYLVNHFSVED